MAWRGGVAWRGVAWRGERSRGKSKMAGCVSKALGGLSARAGEIRLTIVLARAGGGAGLDGETREMGREVVLECCGVSGTLRLSGLVYQIGSLNPSTPPLPIL